MQQRMIYSKNDYVYDETLKKEVARERRREKKRISMNEKL